MLTQEAIDAYNSRATVDLNSIKKMKPADLDRVINTGTAAENLMRNRDFAMFVHQFKFEVCDVLMEIKGHAEEDNALRVALSNQLAGMDGFIATLKRAVHFKIKAQELQQRQQVQEPEELI